MCQTLNIVDVFSYCWQNYFIRFCQQILKTIDDAMADFLVLSCINFILNKLVILLPKSPRPRLSLSIYDQDQYQAEENFLTQVRKTECLTHKSPFQNCCMSSIDCLDLFWYRYKLVSLYCTYIQVYTILLKVGTKYQISNDKQTQITL